MINTIKPSDIQLRPVQQQDNPSLASIIRQVSAEFGLTADKGFAVADPHLDSLFETYTPTGCAYWVIEHNGQVLGGGGIAPLTGSKPGICELQKMYLLPVVRGLGLARRLVLQAMAFAREHGYQHCYLETTQTLTRAIQLYEQLGFVHIDSPLGCTGHVDCEVRMLRSLSHSAGYTTVKT
ncbi:GNAT family N-acetyltransferase [Enterobacteriaceae bacterium LUAb1]